MNILDRTLLLIYLPIALLIYWKILKNQRAKKWFLLVLSLIFYSLGGWQIMALLVGLSLVTYGLAHRKLTWLGVSLNLLALGIFKYWDFGVAQLGRLGIPDLLPILNLALPLGLSYYAFKHIGYLLDIHNDRYEATRDPIAFLTFSVLLFQISAGPISSYGDTGAQLRDLPNKLSPDYSYLGLLHVSIGLAKKLLLADAMLPIFELDFFLIDSPAHGFTTMWVYVFLRGIHLYLDFSGYTDIVLGFAYWFGIALPANFNSPYLAASPSDFWERWHISLSVWFRVYLFGPLSRSLLKRWGSKRRNLAQYSTNIFTMSLVGLWHGAGWGFILWGAYHGLLLNINAWLTRKRVKGLESGYYRFVVLLAVMFGWVFFYSSGFGTLRVMIMSLLGLNGLGDFGYFWAQVPVEMYISLATAAVVTFSGFGEAASLYKLNNRAIAVLAGVLLFLLLTLSGTPSDFTYARF